MKLLVNNNHWKMIHLLIKSLSENLHLTSDNFKFKSKYVLHILIPPSWSMNRLQFMDFLKLQHNCVFDDNSIGKGSSIGRLLYFEYKIYIKFTHNQGEKSAGKCNESEFISLINSYKDRVDSALFFDSTNCIKIDNILDCYDTSKVDVRNYDKADAIISTPSLNYNISLKKDNAHKWERSHKRLKNIYDNFINKHENFGINFKPIPNTIDKFKMNFNNDLLPLIIIEDVPLEIMKNSVFGNDNSIIIKNNFENSSFLIDNNILKIKCNKIYTDFDQLIGTDDEPILTLSHNLGSKYGITIEVSAKKRALNSQGNYRQNYKILKYKHLC